MLKILLLTALLLILDLIQAMAIFEDNSILYLVLRKQTHNNIYNFVWNILNKDMSLLCVIKELKAHKLQASYHKHSIRVTTIYLL